MDKGKKGSIRENKGSHSEGSYFVEPKSWQIIHIIHLCFQSFDHDLAHTKGEVAEEFPVSFRSTRLQGTELNYPAIDKQDFVVFKAMKHFRPYLLRSHSNIIVPHLVVISLLIQKELWDRQEN